MQSEIKLAIILLHLLAMLLSNISESCELISEPIYHRNTIILHISILFYKIFNIIISRILFSISTR